MLRWDDLRKTISHRTIDMRTVPGTDGHLLAVILDLREPTPLADEIIHAGHQAANTPIPGVIGPRFVEVTDQRITLLLDPVSSRAIRLDTLLGALSFRGEGIGAPLAASVAITVLGLLEQIHQAPGYGAQPRVHAEVHKGAVLLAPGGSVALLGPGLAPVNAALLPSLSREVDRFRILSPEAARGEPLDRRADVYGAGVLYYELVTGRPYLDHMTASLVCQRAIEGQPPDLPAQLRRDRPGLFEVLAKALAADRNDRYETAGALSDAIYDELEATGQSLGGARELSSLIEHAVPDQVGKGAMVLLRAEHDADAFGGLLANASATEVRPAGSLGPAPPKFGDWGSVLQQEVTGINKVPEIAAAAAAEFASAESTTTVPAQPIAQVKPISKSDLPLPETLSSPTAPAPPILGGDTPFGDLESPDDATARKVPAGPPSVIIEDSGGVLQWIVIAVAAVALISAGFWMVLGGSDEPTEVTTNVVVQVDAGPKRQPDAAVAVRPAPPPYNPRRTRPAPPPPVGRSNAGYLSVMSSPSGAAVELDGGYVGQTPLVLRHQFELRSYKVRVLAEGHRPWERDVRPDKERRSISVVATLAPK